MTNTDNDITTNAEQALLGAALINPTSINELTITADMFTDARHGWIWSAITNRIEKGEPVTSVFIAKDLANAGQLAKLPQGSGYLHTCIQTCPEPSHAPHYAAIITNTHITRTGQTTAERLHRAFGLSDPHQRLKLAHEAIEAATALLQPPSSNGHHPGNIRLTPASTFEIKPVRWLWQDRIPRGEITLIPGREGTGKSTFLAWMAAAITLGNLPGLHHNTPRAVLYAASEDSWHYTIAPRLHAAGANLDLVYRIDVDNPSGPESLNLPRDCHHLPTVAAQVGAAVLMCDPILSLVDGQINTFKANELRHALEPLRANAEAAGMAVAALVHFNKTQGTDVLSMISGSRAWGEVARAVIAIAHDKTADDYTCVVSQGKNNLGRNDLPSLTYTIDSVTLETTEGDAHVGRLRWTGETEQSAEEILNRPHHTEPPLSENAAQISEYVVDFGHPLTAREISDHFAGQINPATVRQILRRLVTRKTLESTSRGTYQAVSQTSQPRARTHPRAHVSPSQVSQLSQQQVSPITPPVTTPVTTTTCDRQGGTREGRCDSCDSCRGYTREAVTNAVTNPQADPWDRSTCANRCGTLLDDKDTGPVCLFCLQSDESL